MVRVLFFGRLRDLAGAAAIDLAEAPASISALRALLQQRDPGLGLALAAGDIRVAVDQRMHAADALPRDVREIAFMPPLSGG